MRHNIKIWTLLLFLIGCKNNTSENKKVVEEIFDCKKGEMTPARYEEGIDEPIPNIRGIQNGFIIVVDTNNKSTNFISSDEEYSRTRSIELDTFEFDWIDGWEKLSTKQKLEKIKQERKSYLMKADSLHKVNNQGLQQVWIINNTRDTVTLQMQDGYFICVLQAKTKSGQWYPIQYWRFSTCGNSYYFKHFPPKTANSFVTKIPNAGDYKTKLRYKLLGSDKYYYSNEFVGKINYCEFVEDSASYTDRLGPLQPHFNLDSVIHCVYP
ncbi:MAG: hypothetical protein HYZ42_18860 [Bacteroidetes bacterium]|nr:hypothetical protein [Bacteroidota bacterium]